jgi:hypothetical protein
MHFGEWFQESINSGRFMRLNLLVAQACKQANLFLFLFVCLLLAREAS